MPERTSPRPPSPAHNGPRTKGEVEGAGGERFVGRNLVVWASVWLDCFVAPAEVHISAEICFAPRKDRGEGLEAGQEREVRSPPRGRR